MSKIKGIDELHEVPVEGFPPFSVKLDTKIIHIVRCKDCVFYHKDWYCGRPHEGKVVRDPDDFCSRAKSKKFGGDYHD